MSKVIAILFSIVCLCSCSKDKCVDKTCPETAAYNLDDLDKRFVIVKDTTFVFTDSLNNNDTIRIKKRTNFTTFETSNLNCDCPAQYTQLTTEYSYGNYWFQNKDLALQYTAGPNDPSGAFFEIFASDTNAIFHKNYNSDVSSHFQLYNSHTKKNDFDSLVIKGKTYRNIITNFDKVNLSPYVKISGIYYSVGLGIIRFRYNTTINNSSVYTILP